jgi:hypothetical protein
MATGYRVRVWFDPDGLGVGTPPKDQGTVELPVIPQPGMELADEQGKTAVVRRSVLLARPGADGAVALIVCTAR